MTLAENAAAIREKVAKLNPEAKIVAVTKYSDIATTRAFYTEAGCHDLAENRADKFLEKVEALEDLAITWHFIGNLQSRKVKDIINLVDVFHALDSVKLAREIDKRAIHPIRCFLEVNVSGEASKHGFREIELLSAITELRQLTNLSVIGLMTMAPIDASEIELAEIFEKTYQLKERVRALEIPNIPCTELSMGMSRDYEIALQHGATVVRIGSEFLN